MIDALFSWFSRTKFWIWLCRNIISKYTFRHWGYPAFPMHRFFELCKILEFESRKSPCLFAFCSCDMQSMSGKLVRLVTKGKWSHAGWILSGDYSAYGMTIAHMISKGLVVEHLLDELKCVDHFAVVKFELTDYQLAMIRTRINYVLNHNEQFTYDFSQNLKDDSDTALYCSEFIWYTASRILGLKCSEISGRRVFEPDDVYYSGKIIFEV